MEKKNFSFEVLEECSALELDEREKYWIHFYNSLIPKGYNVIDYTGSNITNFNFFNKDIIENIIQDLLNTNSSLSEIARKYHINVSNVSRINQGETHIQEGLRYPLRNVKKHYNYCKLCGKKLANNRITYCRDCYKKSLIQEMKVTRQELKDLIRIKPFTQIGKQFNVSDNAIRKWCEKFNLPKTKKEINSYSDKEWESI